MEQRALLLQVQDLKDQLQEVEAAVIGDTLPLTVLENFKEAVDSIRTTLWATMATKADPFQIGSALSELRIKRTTEMCRRIMLDVDAHEITIDSPGLSELKAALTDAAERMQRLYMSGM